jgi:hypothetical protein
MSKVTIQLKGGPHNGEQMEIEPCKPFVYAGKVKVQPNYKKLHVPIRDVDGEVSLYKQSAINPLIYVYHRF